MKYHCRTAALLILTALMAGSAGAQMMASHAPTSATTAAPAKSSFPEASKVVQSGADASSLIVTGKPVVKVNGAELTGSGSAARDACAVPLCKAAWRFPKKQEAEIRQGALQMIIFEELVYQEALKRKMTVAQARLDREEHNFKGQFASEAEFNEYLKMEQDGSEKKLRQMIKRSLLIDAMLKQEVDNKAVVTLAEARSYYEKNPKSFEHGETFGLQTISIIPPEKASASVLEDSRKKAQSVLAQAKATKNYEQFGLLAEKVSEDDYRVDMGNRKVVAADKLPPEVVRVAEKMKVGEVSGLIPLGTAWTIIRINAHTPPGKVTFVEVKKKLMDDMKKDRYEHLRAGLGKRLREGAQIQEM